jgi:hypothetical protein
LHDRTTGGLYFAKTQPLSIVKTRRLAKSSIEADVRARGIFLF